MAQVFFFLQPYPPPQTALTKNLQSPEVRVFLKSQKNCSVPEGARAGEIEKVADFSPLFLVNYFILGFFFFFHIHTYIHKKG